MELPKDLIKCLIGADIIGNKAFNAFSQERLVEGTKYFFDQIKEILLPTGLNSNKPQPKALSKVKDDRNAVRDILETDTNFSEVLEYPITTALLSIVNKITQ